MSVRTEELRLTVDIAELQRLPETNPAFEGDVVLGPKQGRCSTGNITCCCTHLTIDF
jgi:hypothetical protein